MKFIMMVGLQGSGKSTLARELAEKENAIILSSDETRKELYGNLENQSNHAEVFSLMNKRAVSALSQGQSVIFDSTKISHKSRIDIMAAIQKFDCEKEAIVVARPFEDCVRMNNLREGDAVVPEEKMLKTLGNFQMPYYFEGFTNIRIEYPNPEDKGKYGNYAFAFKDYVDYDQNNPWHNETLGDHILTVHRRMGEQGLTNDEALFQAALLHDIGKPFTCKLNPNTGYCSYYKHANVSAYMSLFYDGLTDPVKTAALISYHNDFLNLRTQNKFDGKFRRRVGEQFFHELSILSQADHPAEPEKCFIKEFTPKEREIYNCKKEKGRGAEYER